MQTILEVYNSHLWAILEFRFTGITCKFACCIKESSKKEIVIDRYINVTTNAHQDDAHQDEAFPGLRF